MKDLISPSNRRGTTLIELLVTVTLLGIVASVATLAMRAAERPAPADPRTIVAESLRAAVAAGRVIVVRASIDGRWAFASIQPGGSVFADSAFHIDRLTGRGTPSATR